MISKWLNDQTVLTLHLPKIQPFDQFSEFQIVEVVQRALNHKTFGYNHTFGMNNNESEFKWVQFSLINSESLTSNDFLIKVNTWIFHHRYVPKPRIKRCNSQNTVRWSFLEKKNKIQIKFSELPVKAYNRKTSDFFTWKNFARPMNMKELILPF